MIEHGGTDAGPAPLVDASTNANPYGPSPAALAALRADVGPYPDPAGTATRAALADHHGLDPAEVVLGAGATELLDRLVRVLGGPVLTEDVTFGEYAGAAVRHDVPVTTAPRHRLAAAVPGTRLVLVASPGSPDGQVRPREWADEVGGAAARAASVAAWDLAYAPLVDEPVPVPAGAVEVHAPNKAHGCTGLRAGWLRAEPDLAERLRRAAVTWSVSTPGLAFLAGAADAAADDWVATHRVRLRDDRDALVTALRDRGLSVRHGEAPFVLVDIGPDAAVLAARLRADHGVKVRVTTSMGLPDHWRLAALPPPERTLLLTALDTVLTDVPDALAPVRRCASLDERSEASP